MKRLLKAILWIGCYGGACWLGIKAKLGFDILSQKHWQMLFDKSVHAQWPAEMANKKLVCKILLLFIIVGIIGLSVVTKKKKKRIPVVKGELPEKGDMRPSFMPSQGKVSNMPLPPLPQQTTSSASAPSPSMSPITEAIHQLTETAKQFSVSVFPHVKLENTFTQLVVSDDATALLLKILPQSGVWQVQQNNSLEESLWSIGEEQPTPVLKDIILSTAILSKLEPEANAISVVILSNGTLQNPTEIKQYLSQKGIRIATLNAQENPDIPKWNELLAEFYPPKESEEKNERNTDSQNI